MSSYDEINYFHLQTLVAQRCVPHDGKSKHVLVTALEREDKDGRKYEEWDRRLLKKELRIRGLGKGGALSSQDIAQKLREDDASKGGRYKPCRPFRDEEDEKV